MHRKIITLVAVLLLIMSTVRAVEITHPVDTLAFYVAPVCRMATPIDISSDARLIAQLLTSLETKTVQGKEATLSVDIPESFLFLGNSLVSGLQSVSTRNDDFLCRVGISLREFNEMCTPRVSAFSPDAVVIEMGSNELGHYSRDEFIAEYSRLVSWFECPVYCLSIPPINEVKSKYASRVSNVNVNLYNSYIQEVCRDCSVNYIDCSEFFGDVLPSSWTNDGLHLKTSIYSRWYNWIVDTIQKECEMYS